jgi:hypothetical protein
MGGILGLWNLDGQPVETSELPRANRDRPNKRRQRETGRPNGRSGEPGPHLLRSLRDAILADLAH